MSITPCRVYSNISLLNTGMSHLKNCVNPDFAQSWQSGPACQNAQAALVM